MYGHETSKEMKIANIDQNCKLRNVDMFLQGFWKFYPTKLCFFHVETIQYVGWNELDLYED